MIRDIDADYRAEYQRRYEVYQERGDTQRAESIAELLRDRYGVDVTDGAGQDEQPAVGDPVPERTDQTAPEAAVEPKPKRRGRPRLPRDENGNIIREAEDAED